MEDSSIELIKIGEEIKNMSVDEVLDTVDDLYSKWVISPRDNIFDYLNIALENFDIRLNELQMGTFERARNISIQKLSYLRVYFNYIDII